MVTNAKADAASPPRIGRRRFMGGLAVGGAALLPGAAALADGGHHGNKRISKGDAALLRFLAAAEILETDLWQQYNELGGIQDAEVPGGSGNAAYTTAISVLDSDMAQYIHDNTENEMTHELFLNGYLMAHGAAPANLEPFRTLPSSQADGADKSALRLTNIMQLTLDTSWWTRYRDPSHNPDLEPNFVFPQAIPDLHNGQFPGIPRTNADLSPPDHLQAIANTAGFHFPSVEVGGTSLYPSLAQRANHPEVLRVILSIGPTEAMHFQTWQDKAGNAPPLTDSTNGLTFPDLNNPANVPPGFTEEDFQTNLIMPEPCPFISPSLPACSIVRPTETKGAAMGALAYLTAMGIFRGQSQSFFDYMQGLAADADKAKRED
jgi:hypothetical protein